MMMMMMVRIAKRGELLFFFLVFFGPFGSSKRVAKNKEFRKREQKEADVRFRLKYVHTH